MSTLQIDDGTLELTVHTAPAQIIELATAPGPRGLPGQSFKVDATGPLADRASHDGEPAGFSFLAVDSSELYIRQGTAGWSPAIPFGKGDPGPKGADGLPGRDGVDGAPGLPGKDGVDGAPGLPGRDGVDGAPGPKGDDGAPGQSFTVDATGPLSSRADHDGAPPGFSYLATDTGSLYIRQGVADWSPGIPFGKGDPGPRGLPGVDGAPGLPGLPGKDGADGAKGEDGPPGTTSWSGLTDKPAAIAAGADAAAARMAIDAVATDDPRLSDSRTPKGGAGGVLSGSYPNPGFAVDMATQAELDAVAAAKVDKTDPRLSDDRAPTAHSHAIADVAGLQTALDGKVATVAGKGLSANDYTLTEKNKLAGIAAGATANATDAQLRDRASHTGAQAISTVTGLQAALDGKVAIVAGKGLSTEDYTAPEKTKLAGIAVGANAYTHPATHPPSIIAQDATARFVTDAEKVAWSAKLSDAPADGGTYGRKDGAWVPAGGGGGSGGPIAIADVTGLRGELDAKVTTAQASAAAPVQTVAGRAGAVVLTKADVGLGNASNTSDANKPLSTAATTALAGKQDKLVSGTSLVTINSQNLLTSGNLTLVGEAPMSGLQYARTNGAWQVVTGGGGGGASLPLGGAAGQVLAKASANDQDVHWVDQASGGGGGGGTTIFCARQIETSITVGATLTALGFTKVGSDVPAVPLLYRFSAMFMLQGGPGAVIGISLSEFGANVFRLRALYKTVAGGDTSLIIEQASASMDVTLGAQENLVMVEGLMLATYFNPTNAIQINMIRMSGDWSNCLKGSFFTLTPLGSLPI